MVNKRYVKKIMKVLETRREFTSQEERQKVEYILMVLIGEFCKSMLLVVFFFLFGWGKQILLSLLVVLITRTYAGGLHQKTSITCLIHSFIFFLFVWYIEKFTNIGKCLMLIYGVIVVLYIIYAPQVSEKRGYVSDQRKKKLKMKSLIGVGFTSIIVLAYPIAIRVVAATLLAIIIDFSLLIIKKEVSIKC